MSLKRLYANNAKTTLTAAVFVESTTISVADGNLFPTPGPNEFFLITIDAGTSKEIVRVGGRTGNTLINCQRGQEGTSPTAFAAGVRVENRVTRDTLAGFARYEDILADIISVDAIPTPDATEATSYMTRTLDEGGTPIIAVKYGDKWRFTSHLSQVVGAVATALGSVVTVNSANVGNGLINLVPGKYIIQFLSGANKGQVRVATGFDLNTVSWSTPLPTNTQAGDTFEIYKSVFSDLKDFKDYKALIKTTYGPGEMGYSDSVSYPVETIGARVKQLGSDLGLYAPINSPTFTGDPKAPTPALGDNDTSIATTSYVQSSVSGVLSKSVSGGSSVTLTAIEAGNGILNFTGVLTANISVIVPLSTKSWIVSNQTTGPFSLTLKTSSGTGIKVVQGKSQELWCNGINVVQSTTDFTDTALAGVSTAPTAATGTNSNQVANTEFTNTTADNAAITFAIIFGG